MGMTIGHSSPLAAVQGGVDRGVVLHKLMEEVLTGETVEDPAALEARAITLIHEFGKPPAADEKANLSAKELTGCVARALSLPQVAALRSRLLPEFPLYGTTRKGSDEIAIAGIADAVALSDSHSPEIIIDWKSDVNPTEAALNRYRSQLKMYLEISGAAKGFIVFLSSGQIISVAPTSHASMKS